MGQTTSRAGVIAEAWRELGEGVAALSNAQGLPLARTVKLVLDPLVVRPVQRPHLGQALLGDAAADELRERILGARDDLAATAAWFLLMKAERRARGITAGNPQDLYFQRAYELARRHGVPREGAASTAGDAVDDVHDDDRVTAADLRAYLTTPAVARAVRDEIDEAWRAPTMTTERQPDVTALLDACATGGDDAFDALVAAGAGAAAGSALRAPGAARGAGMSDRDEIAPPEVGERASKAALPAPFDRSILERLFAAISQLEVGGTAGMRGLVGAEARRSAAPWQLADEAGRVVMTAGAEAGRMGGATDAERRLAGRWQREAFVRRALRAGDDGPLDGAREAFLRRLWARLQGRELRGAPTDGSEAWDLIDGAMRSTILDRRDRAKAEMGRAS
ncbi:hypothetical protein [Microbacterium indicum]|uniref:hypothetical protein n=1 Tax=Microbacterium indicum TaxID=358100 RepID=UPI0003F87C3A|nr:hypothetical protein [Microbacterium indicum]